jgi:two-component system response regulator PilR (NtrC family)
MCGTVLFVSSHPSDVSTLSEMLGPVSVRVRYAGNLREAREMLSRDPFGAILSEAELPDGKWTDVLEMAGRSAASPTVLVTHRLADERLWAEVLDLGAYDLLAQPFDAGEVRRILSSACERAGAKPPATETTSRNPARSAV